MGNWEYKQVYSNVQEVLSTLNKLGGQGWELCAVNGDMFYFKRPMKCVNCKNYKKKLTHRSKTGGEFYDIKCLSGGDAIRIDKCGCEKFEPKN